MEALNHTLTSESEPKDGCLWWDKEEGHAPPAARNEGDKLERMYNNLHAIAAHPRNGGPTFPSFSEEQPPGKGEVSFAQWAFGVWDAQHHYPKALVKEGIMKSLKPPAARDVRHLDETATVARILEKLEDMYGTVTLLTSQYSLFTDCNGTR